MTLVEFIAPLKKKPHKDRVLAVLYYKHRYEKASSLTVENIRGALQQARAQQWAKVNIADVLSRSGHYVDSPGTDGSRRLWALTPSGETYVRTLLGLPEHEPEIEQDVSTLLSLIASISDKEIKDYVEESIKCLQVGARRACVVFLWTGAVRNIQNKLLMENTKSLNTAIQKHDRNARNVAKLDHFAYIKEKIQILAAQELGIFDKNERDTLEEALNLRNRCGHPGKYTPGNKKVSSFIEDVTNIVLH